MEDISVASIVPSPFQPRHDPADADLEALAASIRVSGVMQPVAVRPIPDGDPRRRSGLAFELVAGERRWRAAQLAGLDRLPALVSPLSDQQSAEWALVENVQRTDLTPIERAAALAAMVDRFGLSHGALADRVGLDRSTVSNLIRLMELEDEIKGLLSDASLTTGHAKALLAMAPGKQRIRTARLAAKQGWSVRKLEQSAAAPGATPSHRGVDPRPANIADVEKQLCDHLATRVRLTTDKTGKKGRITIDFYSLEHFDGLMKSLGLRLDS